MANNEKHAYVKLASYDSDRFEQFDPAGNSAGKVVLNSGLSQTVTPEHTGESGARTIASASGSTTVFGDMSVYGLPYDNITLTKTGANAAATVTWAVSTNGFMVIDITMNAADSIAITADNLNGDTFANNIMYIDASDGTIKNAALTGATAETISIWTGR